jgi:2-dehydro-3-deoxyphosphogluconate aldolase/(4S)-4-hydroxy-2-oxoglutarate aldolase
MTMAQNYSRIAVLNTIMEQKLLPLFYHPEPEVGKAVLKACYRGGGRLLEFVNRGAFAHETFVQLSRLARQELPGMMLGVGSVTDAATASLYMNSGATFVVSASLREDIAKVCNRRKVPYFPGCGSLTEIGQAEELGCEIVKLFPGGVYGPEFVKAVLGPQPWTRIMPTGGVAPTAESLNAWMEAGAACVGMGSKLISKELVAEQQFDELEERIRATLALLQP